MLSARVTYLKSFLNYLTFPSFNYVKVFEFEHSSNSFLNIVFELRSNI
jgi:hypothetical protein